MISLSAQKAIYQRNNHFTNDPTSSTQRQIEVLPDNGGECSQKTINDNGNPLRTSGSTTTIRLCLIDRLYYPLDVTRLNDALVSVFFFHVFFNTSLASFIFFFVETTMLKQTKVQRIIPVSIFTCFHWHSFFRYVI